MNIEIANRLVNLRKSNGLSQEALAEKLGISRQAVSKWERAEASPDTDNLILLAKIYKVSLDELLSSEEDPTPTHKTADSSTTESTNGQDDTFEEARFPIAMIAILVYAAIGLFYNIWHPTWLVFLLIPICGGIASAIQQRNWKLLPYPIVIAATYLTIGFLYDAWHPAWLLFLTIPLYYSLIRYFRPKKGASNN